MSTIKYQKNQGIFISWFINMSLFCLVLVGLFLWPKTIYASAIEARHIIELTNQVRIENGSSPLTANQLLTQAAYNKANDLFEQQLFQHNIDDKKFSSWIKETGYDYFYVGENLALDFNTSEGVIRGWENSPSHYKNLINPEFKEIGVISKTANFEGRETTLVVQIFGTQKQGIAVGLTENKKETKIEKQNTLKPILNSQNEMNKPHQSGQEINFKKNKLNTNIVQLSSFIKKYFILITYAINMFFVYIFYQSQTNLIPKDIQIIKTS